MSASLSTSQPFDAFLEEHPTDKNADSGQVPPTAQSGEPPAGLDSTVLATDTTPLSNDLKKTLGPSSATRSITRTATAPAAITHTPANLIPARVVNTFEHYQLAPPPVFEKGKKETTGHMTARNENNLALLADIVGTIDTRVEKLSRQISNLETETRLRDAVRKSQSKKPGDVFPPALRTSTAPPSPISPSSPHTSSVSGFDHEEQLFSRLEDVEQKVDKALDMCYARERATEQLEKQVAAPFTVSQLSDAMKKQFRTITHDRDTLAERIDSDRARQAKINDNHEATVAALQEDIRKLQATIARLELAQGHPPLAPRSSEHIPPPM
ncbi:hypothetical protein C8R45DRAFT_1180455 [Mycena sanguinolenta]|nr:hypothetical protein C8R45DRAFT_1180455 [Mycena sanguinolenta]